MNLQLMKFAAEQARVDVEAKSVGDGAILDRFSHGSLQVIGVGERCYCAT